MKYNKAYLHFQANLPHTGTLAIVSIACSAPRYKPQYFSVKALLLVLQPNTEAPVKIKGQF